MTGPRIGPVQVAEGGVEVAVRLTPRARRNRIEAVVADAAGDAAFRISVTAPPEGGKANVALIALLAKTWRVPKTAIAIAAGPSSRTKRLALAGDGPVLAARIAAWREENDV
ncbi:MAG: DUF167 domain-containing protein [Proteobacteria bacterium]|nr:DUF167 domain-containing protein [Pseudomonadota bacterium]